MGLKKYLSKRNVEESKEPISGSSSSKKLRFCIHKHAATRLHYDFRLEYKGVLLSWAVPKGPSLNPKDKRLAIKVEDHPIDYQYFEGVIPKGNYGAGTVEIWDHGTYTTPDANTKEEIEKYMTQGLKSGYFAVILQGDRLNGEFIFEKLKKDDPADQSWLCIKKNDAEASSDEVIEKKH